jgi:poly(hydroxyalkanoate) depolymerase family esterase
MRPTRQEKLCVAASNRHSERLIGIAVPRDARRTSMRGLDDTIARLTKAAAWEAAPSSDRASTVLGPLERFGSNPGALKAFVHMPKTLAPNAPLVVVLHGCTQSAAGYDRASGWSQLADELGFGLLYPEQQRSNNANGCFNWFENRDTRRDSGEALSIHQMIATVQSRNQIDPRRIFITGLSAGGAMASVMLATYPELFAGGAIIAGLPHGAANGMVEAFDRMRGHNLPGKDMLRDAVRKASAHDGPWPSVSIWHGSADKTVDVANATAIGAQWRSVHGLADRPTATGSIDGVSQRIWNAPDGRPLVEEYIVPGMGHGTPLKTNGIGAYGVSAPFMLDVGISSTLRIAQFWEIAPISKSVDQETETGAAPATLPAQLHPKRLESARIHADPKRTAAVGVGEIINNALRAAGLMK